MKRSIKAQAAAFVEGARYEYGTKAETRAAILAKLAAILAERNALAAELETITSPAQDFAGIGPAPSPDALAELDAATQRRRDALAADLAAKDTLFCEICRAMDAAGLTFSGGEISALKRLGLPDALAAELDAVKAGKIAELPAAERLDADTAKSLYSALTSTGLISGPWDTFAYYLGQQTNPKPKRPETPLSWRRSGALFAYFARRISERMQPGGYGYAIREKPLCLAFGWTDRRRVNDIRPEIQKVRNGHRPKDYAQIDIIFNTL